MDEAFFQKLYQGYAAEHLVSSQLYRFGFEVFRLPADFGLDLVVTNQFKVARKQTAASDKFPFALQVKSRWLNPKDTVIGPSGRPETTVTFWLKADEVDVIIGHKNAGVALVAYVPTGPKGNYVSFYWWLHAAQLQQAREAGFLIQNGTNWFITIRYLRLPRQTREEFVKEIEAVCKLPFEAKRKLLRELPPTFLRQWNADHYMRLARKARDGTDKIIFKSVGNVPMDFSTFPECKPISGLD
ncbi:MAG: hypothetical protein WCS94_24210 [Verrucomicrobiota bacterium]